MLKILCVAGTRPEAIKMAPVIHCLKDNQDVFESHVCVTGQHREMLDQVLSLFRIFPDYDLNIMKPNQDLYDIFSGILMGMRGVYKTLKPDLVLVHGDTSTSVASAMAAFYERIPVGHVEAGLRTYNQYSPWPEEINRQITSRIALYHFAPTVIAKMNLLRENIQDENILVTGNTVIDSLRMTIHSINNSPDMNLQLLNQIKQAGYDFERLKGSRRMILITGHRRENFGEGFYNICHAIKKLSESFPNFDFLYPVHFNPNVRQSVNDILGKSKNDNIFLIDPVEYLPFVMLMKTCYLVLTDSGGIQEEAPELNKPVVVMRDTTERPEALHAGTIELVGTDQEKIIQSITRLICDEAHYEKMAKSVNPFGDGKASDRIIEFLRNKLTSSI